MHKPNRQMAANRPLSILSWSLYDFANTIFSILVVTRYLPPMMKEMTGASSPMGAAVSLSMILAGLMVPVLGAFSDRTGRSKHYLFYSTLICVTATSTLSLTDEIPVMLILFFGANLAYQVSMVFYNSLLPIVSTQENRGRVSGFGVALGYLGSFCALIAANQFTRFYPVQGVFLLAGLMFFIFSLPLFFGVPERPVSSPGAPSLGLLRHRFGEVLQTVRRLPAHPSLLYFLLGNFFCLDAVNTTIVFYSEYLQNARGVSGTGIDQCLIAVQLSALCFAFLIGRWTDKVGPRAMILAATGVWIGAIGTVLLTRSFTMIFAASVMGGFGLGGIWVTGRVLILKLSPVSRIGEFMGLYGMTGKFSAVGALFFGLLADRFSYDVALAFQLVMLLFGAYFFFRVKVGLGPA